MRMDALEEKEKKRDEKKAEKSGVALSVNLSGSCWFSPFPFYIFVLLSSP